MRVQSVWFASLLAVIMMVVGFGATVGTQAAQQGPESWIHIEIDREGDDHVNLNLPLAAIEAALALAPESIVRDGQLQLGQQQVPVAVIRGMWQELRSVGDAEFATIQHEGNNVRIAREGETILVRVSSEDDDGEDVRVEIPVPVVDALLSGDGDMLNIRAAIQELSTMRGEMVRVIAANNNIRVWIDESPTQ
ncbi:MAG: hypothetical protein VX427_15095 [Acidobacteriota bacterium]|nr:hypothetical protein [Acidobacteriota bacterium]